MDVQLSNSLGIDLGTSSVKTGLYDSSLNLIEGTSSEYATRYPADGGAEQSPEDWWNAIVLACNDIREKEPEKWAGIKSVGVTGQFSGTVPVDKDGKALRDAIIWLDSRGEAETRELISGFPGIEGYRLDKLYRWIRLTGGAPTRSGKDSISHILYLRRHEGDLFSRTYKFLEPKDYINFRLTGRMFGTYDSMVLHWITDNRDPVRIGYSSTLLNAVNLEGKLFPELRGAWEGIGHPSDPAREDLKLGNEVVVAGGSGDIQSALIGSGCFDNFEPILYIGTSSWITCHVPFKKTDLRHNIASLPSAMPGKYFVAAEQENAGSALSYAKNILYDGSSGASFSDMDQLAKEAPAGSGGMIFLPWLYGERAPVESRALRSSFFNMSLNHNRSHFARSVLEGVAYNTKWLLGVVEKFVGKQFPRLIMSGGGAQSDIWPALMADILERDIYALDEPVHVNSRGAAILSVMANQGKTVVGTGNRETTRRVFKPDNSTRDVHGKNYETFMRFYNDNRKAMSLLHG